MIRRPTWLALFLLVALSRSLVEARATDKAKPAAATKSAAPPTKSPAPAAKAPTATKKPATADKAASPAHADAVPQPAATAGAAASGASGASGGTGATGAKDPTKPDAPPAGPIQQLVEQRKFQDAILKVKDMRTAAGKPLVDAESEFWAARAENGMQQYDAARERFQAVARAYPDHLRGGQAAIEASTVRLGLIEGLAKTPEEKKIATDAATELEVTAKKYSSNDDIAARAFYVAGNAWRTANEDAASVRDYESARKLTGQDYPAKATYMLGVLRAREFDVDGASALFTECLKKYPDASSAEKCRKGLARLTIIGSAAPPLTVETWLNTEPVDIAALKGNVVIVWFFATWCPHCKATMPQMAELVDHYRGQPVRIIGITDNTKEQTTESAKAFVADPQWNIKWAAAVDKDSQTTVDWQAQGIPAAALVDKKGIVRWADHPVYLSHEMIDRLLAE